MFGILRNHSRSVQAAADRLYAAVVRQARSPDFYLHYGVPDTESGRYEMICVHMFAVLRRLKEIGSEGAALGQAAHDAMFADMDRNLREMGIGDLGVGKRVKKLASGLYGRIAAYDEGVAAGAVDDHEVLRDALLRNLYATAEPPPQTDEVAAMARYVGRLADHLDGMSAKVMVSGSLNFPANAPREASKVAVSPAGSERG